MRPSILYPLFAPISTIKGIGDKYAKLIHKLCGEKIMDILFHLPFNVIDRTFSSPLNQAIDNKIWTGIVTITEHQPPQTKKHPYRVYCTDGTSNLVLIFFKVYKDSIQKNYPVGSKKAISGKLEYFNGMWQMSHPDFVVSPDRIKEIARLEPVYPLTAGITNKMMLKLSKDALLRMPKLPEWQASSSMKDFEYISFNDPRLDR